MMKPLIYKTTEEIFTDIYESNKWGGLQGEFYSGDGSFHQQIVSPYVAMIAEKANNEGFKGLTFVDLGCGDFRVGQQLLPFCSSYIGVDIVKPLILQNQKDYSNTTTQFLHLDIVKDELPDGDVCFVRQVLQHLSNQQIITILQKLKKYKWVFITEHYPSNPATVPPNIDQSCGAGTRVNKTNGINQNKSGVYLDKPPFNLPEESLTKVLEVSGNNKGKGYDPGIICTFLYQLNNQ